MLTIPTAWEPSQYRLDARRATIVKLTWGSYTYYFGDMEIDWGSIHVYPLLISHTGISDKIDPFSKRWATAEITCTISNLPYRKDSNGNWIRPSDDIYKLINDPAEIYLLCGEGASGLSDCLLRFKGIVKENPRYDIQTLSLTLIDHSSPFLDTKLPLHKVGDQFSDTPEEYKDDYIPLVYGEFKHAASEAGFSAKIPIKNPQGLCKGIPIKSDILPPKCVFSDHPLHTFDAIFWQPAGFSNPAEFHLGGKTLSANDSGYGTASFIENANLLLIFLPLGNVFNQDYPFEAQSKPIEFEKVWDRDESSFAIVRDNITDDGTAIVGEGRWGLNNDAAIVALKNEMVGENTLDPWYLAFWGIMYRVLDVNLSSPSGSMFLYYNTDGTNFTRYPPLTGDWPLVLDANWHGHSSPTSAPFGNKNAQFLVACAISSASGGDGTLNNKYMLEVFDLWFWLAGHMPRIDYMWGQIKGRMFSSWIDNPGRSNSYNQNDLIEDPAFIIESLLRDEITYGTSAIDEATFDNAANANVKARINLTTESRAKTRDIIRQLCEQSTFAFHYSTIGKARLIPLNVQIPTTNRTIPYSHIKNGHIALSEVGPFVNKLTVKNTYQPQISKYHNEQTAENSMSQSAYGVREMTVHWPNVTGSSVTELFDHLINNVPPINLLAFEKEVIEIETVGFINADLELGDWIELDDETCDVQIKRSGTSWSGRKYMIIELSQKQDRTRIKAVAL